MLPNNNQLVHHFRIINKDKVEEGKGSVMDNAGSSPAPQGNWSRSPAAHHDANKSKEGGAYNNYNERSVKDEKEVYLCN